MKNEIAPSLEILSAFLSAHIADSADKLTADAKGYLAKNYGVDVSAFDIIVVENSESHIHLSLPYYTGLEEASIQATTDANLADVAGGEFVMGTIAIISVIVIAAIPTSAAVGLGIAAGTGLFDDLSEKADQHDSLPPTDYPYLK